MELTTHREVDLTRSKLTRLENRYEALRDNVNGDDRRRRITMTTLKRLINQFKEEIARFEARHPPRE